MVPKPNLTSLKQILKSRKGRFVPLESHQDFWNGLDVSKLKSKAVKIHLVRQDDDQRISLAKEYFLSTFYQEAPIPRALKLGNPDSGLSFQRNSETRKFLDREMDLYLRSGATLMFSSDGNDCVGVGMCCVWRQDLSYEAVDEAYDVSGWHNVAADIAAQHENPLESHLVWRDFQFQHIYNLAHRLMRYIGRTRTCYLGALYIDKEFRNLRLSDTIIRAVVQTCSKSNTLPLIQSNFRGFDRFVERNLENGRIVETMKYEEETLVVDGEKRFEMLKRLDGMRFYADFGRTIDAEE